VRAEVLEYAADVAVDLSGVVVSNPEVAIDNLLGIVVPQGLGEIPEGVKLDAYEPLGNGQRLFSLDTHAELPGGLVAAPADVVRSGGAAYALVFDAMAAGIPDGADVDAVAVDGSGRLVLSFDVMVDLGGGVVASDEDLVRFDGSGFSMLFDASEAGMDPALDLDAASVGPSGSLLLSFDTHGVIDGIPFSDDTVLSYSAGVWTSVADVGDLHPGFAGADVIALPEPGPWLGIGSSVLLLACLHRQRCRSARASGFARERKEVVTL
jgi:hypothetical protein